MEFSVFQRQQDHLAELPFHQATRTVASLVIAAGLAEKIGQNAIKLTSEAEWKEVKRCARNYTPAFAHSLRTKEVNPIPMPAGRLETYLDGKLIGTSGYGLPPREVEGCWFQQPQSDSWKIQHRTANLQDVDRFLNKTLPQLNRGLEGLVSSR